MKEENGVFERSIRTSAFSALICSTLGFVLLEAAVIRIGGKPAAHAMVLSIGVILAFAFYRGIAPYYPAAAMHPHQRASPIGSKLPSAASAVCAALLAIFGYAGVAALSSGSMTIFAVFTACAFLFPWSKIARCRRHIFIMPALIAAAAVFGLLTLDQLPHAVFLLMAAWMLGMAAIGAWLSNIFYRQRESKASRRASQHRQEEPSNVVQNEAP